MTQWNNLRESPEEQFRGRRVIIASVKLKPLLKLAMNEWWSNDSLHLHKQEVRPQSLL